ncbi:hypothetical protein IWX89_003282 [Cryobacterium sp. MP_M3]|uniref:hypothetical protein n=1 Tax=unclassified Cryobacterium TaxID=2649013 RepID=UPI0018C95859|nr:MULTISPECIES: hypothetical protein [unclassified Cryobacterium]MBG6059817.1 hypothetical protein [Cryobacterium sp. MP_M3]
MSPGIRLPAAPCPCTRPADAGSARSAPRIAAGLAELIDTGTVLHAVAIAFDPKPGAERPGLIKVLAAPPATIEHLFRRLPRAATIALPDRDAVLAG